MVPKYTTLGWVGFFLFEIPIRLFFTAIFIVSCLALLRDPDPTFGFKVFALLCTCLGVLWFLIGFPLTFALVEIGEIKKDAEGRLLEQLLQRLHPNFRWRPDQRITLDVEGGPGFDNRLIVLRQQGRIFINFATLGRGDSTVFSMGIINYYRSRQVKKRFRECLAA